MLTGHSHIDVAWLWRVQESIRKSARTFTNVTSLMDIYPEMTFGQSEAVLYDMVKRHYPEIYEKLKEKVAAGQWDICGNVWVEADTWDRGRPDGTGSLPKSTGALRHGVLQKRIR